MRCYGQIIYESGSYAAPFPDEYEEWNSIQEAKDRLAGCWDDMDVDPANGQGVSLQLWLGAPPEEVPYPCDGAQSPPDRVYELGPRCGVRISC